MRFVNGLVIGACFLIRAGDGTIIRAMELTWLQVPQWQTYDGLLHGFMGRRGGKSSGSFAGLNLSYRVGDDNRIVSANVCDMKQAVGIHDERIVTMKQVHGDTMVEVVDKKIKEAGECDGMVTAATGVFLGVLTADCVPILLVAPKQKKAAAIHAGWRGTLAGIAAKAVREFSERYGIAAADIEAALGPSIEGCCYEVGDDVTQPMVARWGAAAEACIERTQAKPHLDLRALNRAILGQTGVPAKQIFVVGPCTSCGAEDFYSYRRDGAETGRQMSFIGWRD